MKQNIKTILKGMMLLIAIVLVAATMHSTFADDGLEMIEESRDFLVSELANAQELLQQGETSLLDMYYQIEQLSDVTTQPDFSVVEIDENEEYTHETNIVNEERRDDIPPSLDMVEFILTDENQLLWSAVPNAIGYRVYATHYLNQVSINSLEVDVPLSESFVFDLSEFINTSRIGSHRVNIFIRAVADGIEFSDSLSEILTIRTHSICLGDGIGYGCVNILPRIRPVELTLTLADQLTWSTVPHATAYHLSVRRYLNDSYVENLETKISLSENPTFDLSEFIDRETLGLHRVVIEMHAVANGVEFANSAVSELNVLYDVIDIGATTPSEPITPSVPPTGPTSSQTAPNELASSAQTLPETGSIATQNTVLMGSVLVALAGLGAYIKSKKN